MHLHHLCTQDGRDRFGLPELRYGTGHDRTCGGRLQIWLSGDMGRISYRYRRQTNKKNRNLRVKNSADFQTSCWEKQEVSKVLQPEERLFRRTEQPKTHTQNTNIVALLVIRNVLHDERLILWLNCELKCSNSSLALSRSLSLSLSLSLSQWDLILVDTVVPDSQVMWSHTPAFSLSASTQTTLSPRKAFQPITASEPAQTHLSRIKVSVRLSVSFKSVHFAIYFIICQCLCLSCLRLFFPTSLNNAAFDTVLSRLL